MYSPKGNKVPNDLTVMMIRLLIILTRLTDTNNDATRKFSINWKTMVGPMKEKHLSYRNLINGN